MSSNPVALVTGASSGIGAVYADRFARRGHNLVLVARNAERLDTVATGLRDKHGVQIEVVQADLAGAEDLSMVANRLADDARIDVLVNNAGIALSGGFIDQSPADVTELLAVNVAAVTRLAQVAAQRFAHAGRGAIINISSVVGLVPEFRQAAYAASKAYVTTLSQAMAFELSSKGVQVQCVLPAGTVTPLWERSGLDTSRLPQMMDAKVLVDAAMVGFDRGETITIPVLSDAGQWDDYQAARMAMISGFSGSQAAARYASA
ncbi:short-subunit dehydrogenase [Brevundimonas vesicularis]|uniref:Short-subunit dehydrogenase n=1 Tax=Brevundimonas vesicularis TaxID=41276 RepID=A0A7W9FRJ8_BREVE|nr:SDR family oxidoreductase [Brevundimonas vesicularis]MBB5770255.1 short-subunit dehydrogenase [Brevundimonas vesicularis]